MNPDKVAACLREIQTAHEAWAEAREKANADYIGRLRRLLSSMMTNPIATEMPVNDRPSPEA